MMKIVSEFRLGDMRIRYESDEEGQVGMELYPASMKAELADGKSYRADPLVQWKKEGDAYPFGFANGLTMRNSESVSRMKYKGQQVEEDGAAVSYTHLDVYKRQEYYIIDKGGIREKVFYKEILYIYKEKKNAVFVTDDGISTVRSSLNRVMDELHHDGFVYINKGIIINISRIQRMKGLEIMLDNKEQLCIRDSWKTEWI